MKTIIAGGRNYVGTHEDWVWLCRLPITSVLSGGCRGADAFGEQWAIYHGLPLQIIRPDWRLYGKAAGPMRNRAMASVAEACVLFPGGDGTADMRVVAQARHLRIFTPHEC